MDLSSRTRCLLQMLVITVLLVTKCSSIQSVIGGNYTEDTTLDLAGSPYYVTSNLFIYPNATLVIKPGVELYFNPNVGVIVSGALIANGTKTQRIKFSRNHEGNFSIPTGYHQLRLIDDSAPNKGKLQSFYNSKWSYVRSGWGENVTRVACRQLGYKDGTAVVYYNDREEQFAEEYAIFRSQQTWFNCLQCSGKEDSLNDCQKDGERYKCCKFIIH